MTRERLQAILDEQKTNPDTFNKSGPGYFLEFLPAIEGYFSYAEAIAHEAEVSEKKKKESERIAAIEASAKKAQESKKRR
jgi:hypothetical protein